MKTKRAIMLNIKMETLGKLKSEIERISNLLETEPNENSVINEDNIYTEHIRYSEHVKYSIQIKDGETINPENFKTEQEANEYATKIGLKQNEYSVIPVSYTHLDVYKRQLHTSYKELGKNL